jgi:hypothetical protein
MITMKDSTKTKKYKIVLKVLGQEWKIQGNSILEALQALTLDWNDIKGKGTITVSYGSKSHEHLMSMLKIRRMFANKIVMIHQAKNLELFIK